MGSSAWKGPQIEDVAFIIEAVGHQVDCGSSQTKKKVGIPLSFVYVAPNNLVPLLNLV